MKNIPRILQVFASLNRGGAECRMMDVYRNIDRKKLQFDFITMSKNDNYFADEICKLGGDVYYIPNPREAGIYKNYLLLKKLMKKNKYIAVHAHTSYHCGIICCAAYKAKIKIRIAHARTTGSIKRGSLMKYIGRYMIHKYSTHRIAISMDAGNYLFRVNKKIRDDFIFLPNAIDLQKFENINFIESSLQKRLQNKFVVGHVGRFSKMKNHEFLIDTFNEILKINKNSLLLLIGNGELEDEIKNKIKTLNLLDYVIFTGIRDNIPELMSMMNVFVFPSVYEGLGGCVLEAQISLVRCYISSNLPNELDIIPELITRISLLETPKYWAEEITKNNRHNISFQYVKKRFNESGYSVVSEVKFLLDNIYGMNENGD